FEPEARRLLVGASALAVPNRARGQKALGARNDGRHLQNLVLGGDAGYPALDFHRTDSRLWLDGLFLDGRATASLLAASAMPGEQPDASWRSRRGRRLERQRLVAWSLPTDRLGRELAQESSHARGLRAPGTALVPDRHRLVFYLLARSRGIGSLGQAASRLLTIRAVKECSRLQLRWSDGNLQEILGSFCVVVSSGVGTHSWRSCVPLSALGAGLELIWGGARAWRENSRFARRTRVDSSS